MSQTGYHFNAGDFAYEEFPDEVVVLDVIDGAYYSLGGSTPLVWPALIAGHEPKEIAGALAGAVGAPEETVTRSLDDMVGHLVAERILVAGAADGPAPDLSLNGEAHRFTPFTFEKHVDMQDLLTLDPIHDVDRESGWPKR